MKPHYTNKIVYAALLSLCSSELRAQTGNSTTLMLTEVCVANIDQTINSL